MVVSDREAVAEVTQIIGSLDIRKYDARRWMYLHQQKFILNNGSWLLNKRGLVVDFGSIPKRLWSLEPPLCSEADEGYGYHDGGYAKNRDDSPFVEWSHPHTREEVDAGMREIHLHCGVSQDRADMIYNMVRRFASYSWLNEVDRAARIAAVRERNSLDDGIRDL